MSVASVASYVWGQCTAFVASTLDWVPAGLGNANQWAARAQAAGYPVGSTAHVGDVAVWPSGYAGAHSQGHVAVVTGITPISSRSGTGGITVAEQNWSGGVGVSDTRFVPREVLPGLTFISPKGIQQSNQGIGNPFDAIGNAVSSIEGGAVGIGLYAGFAILAILLIIVGLITMALSSNTGRSAAKGAILAV